MPHEEENNEEKSIEPRPSGEKKNKVTQADGAKNPALQNELLTRLKKIEGQVRGVQKMVQEYRDCGDVVTQLTAIKAAVNRVSITVLACHLADQIKDDLHEGKDIQESLTEFMHIFKRFS